MLLILFSTPAGMKQAKTCYLYVHSVERPVYLLIF